MTNPLARVSRRWWLAFASVACLGIVFATSSCPLPTDRLAVFFTSTAHGNLEQCGCPANPSGGVSRRAAFIRAHAPEDIPFLLLDGADIVGPPTPVGLVNSQFMFRALDEMGYSVLGLGARDFSFGASFLRSMEEKHGITFVGTNLLSTKTRTQLFRPHAVIRIGEGGLLGIPVGGLKVGVLSVMGQDVPPFASDVDDSLFLLEPVVAVRHYARQLRRQCDMVVVLAYTKQVVLDSIVNIPDVDVVVSTRTLTVPTGYENVGMRKHAVLAYTGYEARRIGVMTLKRSPDGEVSSAKGELIVLGENKPEDQDMNALIRESRRAVAALSDAGTIRQESRTFGK